MECEDVLPEDATLELVAAADEAMELELEAVLATVTSLEPVVAGEI